MMWRSRAARQIPIACPEEVTAKPERVEWVPLVSARGLGMTQVWALVWEA